VPTTLDLKAIERLAPDQAALQAAAGLRKPAKWSAAGGSFDGQLIWAACAGSGANPYRVMADLGDLGSKCTCPSRKFPCKHAIALLWMRAEETLAFPVGDTPDWVRDWLGRRRKGAAGGEAVAESSVGKDLAAALIEAPASPDDPKALARREAAAARRAAETREAVVQALDALEQWVGDQLRLGLAGFIAECAPRCRRIAARLVDGKAAVLAGRVDELPSRLLVLEPGERVRGAVVALGKLVLLTRAWRARPDDPEIARAVIGAEPREMLIADPATLRSASSWEVAGERIETRRDGLVAQTTWLLNLLPDGPRFAMLIDFTPASAGRRASAFTPGEQFTAELAYYPARQPLRALLLNRSEAETISPCPIAVADEAALLDDIAERAAATPWVDEMPLLLPAGRIAFDGAGKPWWRARDGSTPLPVNGLADGLPRATDLLQSAAIWSGGALRLLAAQTSWGRIACDA
jgi:hypothetical protein